MTIDEAIAHERESVRRNNMLIELDKLMTESHVVCMDKERREILVKFHEQLAEWLEELKMLRELKEEHRKIGNIEGFNKGYNKAIDDFADRIIRYVDCGHLCSPTEVRWSDLSVVEMVKKLAEQLKAGGENE